MNRVKDEVVIEIPIKKIDNNQLEDVGVQTITSNANTEFTIGSKDNPKKFTIYGFASDKMLVINNSNHEFDELINENSLDKSKNEVVINIKNITVEDNNNIVISVDSNSNKTFVIEPTQLVVKENKKIVRTYKTNNTKMEIPFNFDSLISNEYIKVKNLPYQFKKFFACKSNLSINISAQRKLNSVDFLGGEVETFENKEKNIEIYKLYNSKTGKLKCFVAHKSKLVQVKIENSFSYKTAEQENMVGFVLGEFGKSTKALAYKKLTEEQKNEIVNFLNQNTPTENQVKQFLSKNKQVQAVAPKTIAKPKYLTRIIKNLNTIEALEAKKSLTKSIGEEQMEGTINNNTSDETNDDKTEGTENAIVAELAKNSTETENAAKTPAVAENEVEDKTDTSTNAEAEVKAKESPEQAESGAEVKVKESPEQAEPETEDKVIDKKEEKKEEKQEEKVETVDLSHIGKVIGVSLFMFGFFTGFGGLLLMIIAMGIGSSAWATDNLKNVGKNWGTSKFNNLGKIDLTKPAKLSEEQKKVQEAIKLKTIDTKLGTKILKNIEEINTVNADGFIKQKQNEFKKQLSSINEFITGCENRLEDARNGKKRISDKALGSIQDNLKKYKTIRDLLNQTNNEFNRTTEKVTKKLEAYLNDTVKFAENTQNLARIGEITDATLEDFQLKIKSSDLMAKSLDGPAKDLKNAETEKLEKEYKEMQNDKALYEQLELKVQEYNSMYTTESVGELLKNAQLSMTHLKTIYNDYNNTIENMKKAEKENKKNATQNNKVTTTEFAK